jgi:hypothetical protein
MSKYEISIHAAENNCRFIINYFKYTNIVLLHLVNNVGKWKVCYFLESHQEKEVNASL